MEQRARIDDEDKLTVWVKVHPSGEAMFCFTLESEAEEFAEFVNENCTWAGV